jgi:CheY-like chemotaxis protein
VTILVVDDDRVACTYLESSLKRARGFNIEVANDAASALETLSKCIVDLLVIDLTLPDVDGFKLVRRLQREPRLKDIPIVIMSSDRAHRVQGHRASSSASTTTSPSPSTSRSSSRASKRSSVAPRPAGASCASATTTWRGDFTGIAFSDLVNMFSFGQRSGVLSIVTRRAAGKIVFVPRRALPGLVREPRRRSGLPGSGGRIGRTVRVSRRTTTASIRPSGACSSPR